MSKPSDPENLTLSIEKVFDAPINLVWEAYTSPEHLIYWWAPQSMSIKIISHDFRVGGIWKYSMPMPDGSQFVSEGTFMEIEPYKKIVTTADFRPMTENVVLQILFEEEGEKTVFHFSVIHTSEEYKIQQERMGFYNGWGSAFNRMEALIKSLAEKNMIG